MAPKNRFCYLESDNIGIRCVKHGYDNCPRVICSICGCGGHSTEEHRRADMDDMMEKYLRDSIEFITKKYSIKSPIKKLK